MAHYGDFQTAIYGAGLRGVIPKLPVDYATLVRRAAAAMPPQVLTYVQGGCGDEHTQDVNASAFHHWGMVPRMLVDCTKRDLSLNLFGLDLPSPVFMAPIGVNGICTQDNHGDVAAARASALAGVPFCASTLSNDPLEDVAKACGDTPAFFQLYTPRHQGVPRASSTAPRPQATRRWSSRWTPGSPAGALAT
jgi:lactate 2-monooxygenase